MDPLGLSEEQAEKVRKFHEFYKKGRDAIQDFTDLDNPALKFGNQMINSIVDSAFKRTANSLQYGEDSYIKAAYEGVGSVAAENLPVVGSAERLYQGDRINDETGQMEKTSTGQKVLDFIALAADVATVVPGKGKLLTKAVDKLKDIPVANKLMGMADDVLKLDKNATLKNTSQVLKNKIKGDAFRDEIADLMQKEGLEVQKEVVKKTPFGKRVIDIEVSKDGVILGGIETKAGKSAYKPSQRAKDKWLQQFEDYSVNVERDE